jgi:polyisoprenoid-binding protein YceI
MRKLRAASNAISLVQDRWRANRRAWRLALLLLLSIAAENARGQIPGIYRINPALSRIEIHVYRAGILGDNHLILLRRFSGFAESKDGQSWAVQVIAEAGSLEVADPGASIATRRRIQTTMLGPKQMDVARFPQIKLESRSVEPAGSAGRWRILSVLTMHGTSRDVEFPISWQQRGRRLRVRGEKVLELRAFRIQPISLAFGALRVRNKFEVGFDITLEREPQSEIGRRAPKEAVK